MSEKIKISIAKGRPMLHWVGKKPLEFVKAFPAQLVEIFAPLDEGKHIEIPTYDVLKTKWQNLLFHGDNKEVLAYLIANGFRAKIDLIYIDPPFDSGADYIRKVELRGIKERTRLRGEGYSLGEQIQYTDIWARDNYLQFMYERLLLMKELLAKEGLILLHCDYRRNSYLRLIMDEIFGPENFRNEIIVKRGVKSLQAQFEKIDALASGNDVIYLYSKNTEKRLTKLEIELKKMKKGSWNNHWRGSERPTMRYPLFGITPASGQWRWSEGRSKQAIRNYEEYLKVKDDYEDIDDYYTKIKKQGKKLDFLRLGSTGKPEHYVPPRSTKLSSTVWTDIRAYSNSYNFPTEKNEALLERIINWLCPKEGIVLDCFIGSGTTAAVAQKLQRKWIGCDINKNAIQITSKRLQQIIHERLKKRDKASLEPFSKNLECPSFGLFKVNDYDLQILKLEAKQLVIEHIGIQRSKSDIFFDGTLGRNLVKIIDFNHPLTLLDLQLIQDELKRRPNENRNVTVVCLGKEITIEPWIENYNKKHPVNKFEVIELRTDKKYGKFLIHKPAEAKVKIERRGNKAIIEIQNFISPSIINRLNDPESLMKVKIPDYRCMIDVILIDQKYDGKIFNIGHSDVPKKKRDLVKGRYEIKIPTEKTVIAVKIIDMLGEEILIAKEV